MHGKLFWLIYKREKQKERKRRWYFKVCEVRWGVGGIQKRNECLKFLFQYISRVDRSNEQRKRKAMGVIQ